MSDKIPDKHERPALSGFIIFFGVIAAAAWIYTGLYGSGWDPALFVATLTLFVMAEALDYLARCAWRLDQIGTAAVHHNAQREKAEAEAKLAAEADKHRAEVRAIAETLRPS